MARKSGRPAVPKNARETERGTAAGICEARSSSSGTGDGTERLWKQRMDHDIYMLNLIFLQKAREWLAAGEDHKAELMLGLSPETTAHLKTLPVARLQALAASPVLSFTLRVPPKLLAELARETETPWSERLRWQVLASVMTADGDARHRPPFKKLLMVA